MIYEHVCACACAFVCASVWGPITLAVPQLRPWYCTNWIINRPSCAYNAPSPANNDRKRSRARGQKTLNQKLVISDHNDTGPRGRGHRRCELYGQAPTTRRPWIRHFPVCERADLALRVENARHWAEIPRDTFQPSPLYFSQIITGQNRKIKNRQTKV